MARVINVTIQKVSCDNHACIKIHTNIIILHMILFDYSSTSGGALPVETPLLNILAMPLLVDFKNE